MIPSGQNLTLDQSKNKMKTTDIFKGKEIEASSHDSVRHPEMLYISIDEQCNQNCAFCVVKGGNEGKFGSMSTSAVKKMIRAFIGSGGRHIIFTGGEPTLRNDLPGIIAYAEKFAGLYSIAIITNGTRLSDKQYGKDLLAADKKNKLGICVSLHSHKERISESLTHSFGTFKKTMRGIEYFVNHGKNLSIYHVITSRNYKDLPGFVKFLNKTYPRIKDVTFAYPFPQGNALLNDWIYVKFSALKPYFLRTLSFLEKEKYNVSIASCGQFPLCILPGFEEKVLQPLSENEENVSGVVGEKSFHEFEMSSSEWIDQYKIGGKGCRNCILNRYCQGFWKKYVDLFSFNGMRPVTISNFKGNKIRAPLTSGKQMQEMINRIKTTKMNLILLAHVDDDYLKGLLEFLRTKKVFAVVVHKKRILYPLS